MDRYTPALYDSMEKNDNGDWVRYEDAAARIAELVADLEAANNGLKYWEDIKDENGRLRKQLAAV